jgi:hypothetical protein
MYDTCKCICTQCELTMNSHTHTHTYIHTYIHDRNTHTIGRSGCALHPSHTYKQINIHTRIFAHIHTPRTTPLSLTPAPQPSDHTCTHTYIHTYTHICRPVLNLWALHQHPNLQTTHPYIHTCIHVFTHIRTHPVLSRWALHQHPNLQTTVR